MADPIRVERTEMVHPLDSSMRMIVEVPIYATVEDLPEDANEGDWAAIDKDHQNNTYREYIRASDSWLKLS